MLKAPVRLQHADWCQEERYRDLIYEEMVKNCQWYLSCMGKYNMMGFITLLLTFIFLYEMLKISEKQPQ